MLLAIQFLTVAQAESVQKLMAAQGIKCHIGQGWSLSPVPCETNRKECVYAYLTHGSQNAMLFAHYAHQAGLEVKFATGAGQGSKGAFVPLSQPEQVEGLTNAYSAGWYTFGTITSGYFYLRHTGASEADTVLCGALRGIDALRDARKRDAANAAQLLDQQVRALTQQLDEARAESRRLRIYIEQLEALATQLGEKIRMAVAALRATRSWLRDRRIAAIRRNLES